MLERGLIGWGMSTTRPAHIASAPTELLSEETGKEATSAYSTNPETPEASFKAERPTTPPSYQNLPLGHTSLTAMARLLGRQFARDASSKGGCDD